MKENKQKRNQKGNPKITYSIHGKPVSYKEFKRYCDSIKFD